MRPKRRGQRNGWIQNEHIKLSGFPINQEKPNRKWNSNNVINNNKFPSGTAT